MAQKKLENSPSGVTQEQTPFGAVVYENGVPSNELVQPKDGDKIEAAREDNGDAGTQPTEAELLRRQAGIAAAAETEKQMKAAAKKEKKDNAGPNAEK